MGQVPQVPRVPQMPDVHDAPGTFSASGTVRRQPQLDGLRAVAVAAVAWSHWERDYQAGIPFGAGVHLFFVLSGFLITRILLDVRQASDRGAAIRAFYIRRALRIFPAFYVTLLLAWIAGVPLVRESLAWHATYLSNVWIFQMDQWPGSISHLWSLAVEEQFYLAWPFLILAGVAIAAARRARVARLIAGVIGLATVLSLVYSIYSTAVEPSIAYFSTFTRAWEFGIGALLAIFLRRVPIPFPTVPAALASWRSGTSSMRCLLLRGTRRWTSTDRRAAACTTRAAPLAGPRASSGTSRRRHARTSGCSVCWVEASVSTGPVHIC